MNAESREPSRLPIRGTIATAGTVGALVLLMSFRGGPLAPAESAVAAGDDAPATDELVASAETQTSGAAASVEPATITGQPFETRWGDVQVEVTLAGSDITEVVALVMPDSDRHTIAISDYLEPILAEEAITYDTADVSVISGATYTSEAYAASLQSALDQAHEVADEPAAVVSEPEAVVDETSTKVRTATGEAVGIRWGDVQVAVTVEGGDVIEVETLAIPMDDRKSERINTTAEPILREEAITYDTADVSVVSGATYTSRAYATSLQSALDQLGF